MKNRVSPKPGKQSHRVRYVTRPSRASPSVEVLCHSGTNPQPSKLKTIHSFVLEYVEPTLLWYHRQIVARIQLLRITQCRTYSSKVGQIKPTCPIKRLNLNTLSCPFRNPAKRTTHDAEYRNLQFLGCSKTVLVAKILVVL